MPVDLGALLEPSRAALLLMECQEGIIGEGGTLSALAEAVRRNGTGPRIARVLAAARARGVPVFHCLMARRPDGAGAAANCLLLAATRKSTRPLLPGSPQQAPVAALAPTDGEWVVTLPVSRRSTAPSWTAPRNLGVRTVVATGVSVNIGVSASPRAVNRLQVVIPRRR